DVQQYAMGCIPDSESVLEDLYVYKDMPKATDENLPDYVDLESKLPSPGNQGSQGSCTAWAVAYAAKSYQENQEHSWVTNGWSTKTEFSPAYLYNQINHGVDKGSSITTAMSTIQEKGICSLYDMPYNQNDYLTQPNTYQYERASNFKISSYYSVRGAEEVKEELADGNPVIISIPVYSDFDNLNASNPIYDNIEGNRRGYHAICLIGYDDRKQAFKLINSWGDSRWGVKGSYYNNKYGYGYISYDLFEQSNVSGGWGYVMSDEVQHYKSNPHDIKALQNINVYSDTALKTKVKTINSGETITVLDYVKASDGNPPVLKVDDGFITAKAEVTQKLNTNTAVVYNGYCNLTEINVYELGKNIEGSKLRFTYTSNKPEGHVVVGVAARSYEGWTWLQSDNMPAFLSEGPGVTSVVEMTYDEFEVFADIEGTELRNYIFQDWGLAENTNLKIELITPVVAETITEVFNTNGNGAHKDISPYELGKNIDGAKIRVTFTSDYDRNSLVIGVSGKRKTTFGWVDHEHFLYSKGKGMESVYTFNYDDFVNYFGIGDDFACFVFQDYGTSESKEYKIELVTPVEENDVSVLCNGRINLSEFTPEQLGKNIEGAKIRITFTSSERRDIQVLGISGKQKGTWKWMQNEHGLLSKGIGRESVYTFNYNDFVDYIGIGDDLECFVFQNWGLVDGICKIEVLTPIIPTEIITVLYDDVIEQWESIAFTPEQLGQGIDGSKLQITYEPSDQTIIGQSVVGIAGIKEDGSWLQSSDNPAFVKNNNGINIEQLTYSQFVDLANINESDVNYYVFSNWRVKSGTNVKIELIVPNV
ncbi:MAG: hypothetical protein K2F81_07465, partial [Ruminococcus sp.]|nr:hypothetical protein [Ruminococcus sp.]